MSDTLWPWLLVAGAGALHGLNPATGWLLATGWGLQQRDPRQAVRALLPLAIGHLASIGLVVAVVAWGWALHPRAIAGTATALLALAVLLHLRPRTPRGVRAPAGQVGMALWSFVLSTAHGAGLALVPALVPLCIGVGAGPHGGTPGLLLPTLAAVGVHTAAMLAVTGVLATTACRASGAAWGWIRRGPGEPAGGPTRTARRLLQGPAAPADAPAARAS